MNSPYGSANELEAQCNLTEKQGMKPVEISDRISEIS
jgi:hypothetical protein